jgi:hypothetical protein
MAVRVLIIAPVSSSSQSIPRASHRIHDQFPGERWARFLSYKTLFFNIVTTIGYALSPAMNKSLHATLVKICTSGCVPLFHSLYDGVVASKATTLKFGVLLKIISELL